MVRLFKFSLIKSKVFDESEGIEYATETIDRIVEGL